MDAKTLEALKASIEKWKRNAVAETPAAYSVKWRECPLCVLFYLDDCSGCPVSDAGRHRSCEGTPYYVALEAQNQWRGSPKLKRPRNAAHAAALKEVAFLESLLPTTQENAGGSE